MVTLALWGNNRRNVPVRGRVHDPTGTFVPIQSTSPHSLARTIASVRLDTSSLA